MQNFDLKVFFKKAWPHALAVLGFFVISSLFFAPPSEGKRLHKSDSVNFTGMAHETLSYESIEGDRPGWTDSMFGGMPTIQITGSGQMTFGKYIWKFLRLFMNPEVMTLFMAMLSAYILALCLKAPPIIAFIVGATFGLGSINTLYLTAGHATKVRAISVMPGVIAGVITAFRGRRWLGAGLAAIFLTMHIDANHLQMTYYLLYLVAAIGISELISAAIKGQIKSALTTSAILVCSALAAVLPSAPNLVLTKNYSHHTTRGESIIKSSEAEPNSGLDKEYILQYSMAKGEWLSMISPNIKGGTETIRVENNGSFKEENSYWGEQSSSGGAFYFGAIAFALMLCFFFFSKDIIRFPLLLITILAIILSWRDASWITDIFLDNIPYFSSFRDTKMMLVLVQVCVAVASALALKHIWDKSNPTELDATTAWKPVIYSLSGVTGILFFLYLFPNAFFDFHSTIRADQLVDVIGRNSDLRIQIFRADLLRSILLILVATGAIFLSIKKILDRRILIVIIGIVMISELYSVDKRYISERNYAPSTYVEYPHQLTQEDYFILQNEIKQIEKQSLNSFGIIKRGYLNAEKRNSSDRIQENSPADFAISSRALNSKTHYRVFNLVNPFADARTSYFHKSVGGYHGAKLLRYQNFIDSILLPKLNNVLVTAQKQGDWKSSAMNISGLEMLNTKYITYGGETPIQLTSALGPAWMVYDTLMVDDAETELISIRTTDVSKTAIVHNEFIDALDFSGGDSSITEISSVELIKYHPDGSTYQVNTSKDGLMVLSEIWYPEGWSATIDGEDVELIRVNYILRALPIKSGSHRVVLYYTPPGAIMAKRVSTAGSVVLLMFISFSFFYSYRKKEMCCEW